MNIFYAAIIGGVSWNTSFVTNLLIPHENFEQFVELIDIVPPNDAIVHAINKNLPNDYNITKFPKLVVDQMLKLLPYDVIYVSEHSIKMWNSGDDSITNIKSDITGSIVQIDLFGNDIWYAESDSITIIDTVKNHSHMFYKTSGTINIVRILNNRYFMICSNDITILDVIDGCFVHQISDYDFMSYRDSRLENIVGVSPNGTQVAYVCNSFHIFIYCIENIAEWKFVREIIDQTRISCLCYSPDSQMLISGDIEYNVKIWNVANGELLEVLDGSWNGPTICVQPHKIMYPVKYTYPHIILYSPDNLKLVYCDRRIIRVFDMVSRKLMRKLSLWDKSLQQLTINNMEYLSDSKYIICRVSNDSIIKLNVDTGDYSVIVQGCKSFKKDSNLKIAHIRNYDRYIAYKKYLDEDEYEYERQF